MQAWIMEMNQIDRGVSKLMSFMELSKKYRQGEANIQETALLLSIIVKRNSLDKYPDAYKIAFDTLVRKGYLTPDGNIVQAI